MEYLKSQKVYLEFIKSHTKVPNVGKWNPKTKVGDMRGSFEMQTADVWRENELNWLLYIWKLLYDKKKNTFKQSFKEMISSESLFQHLWQEKKKD